MLSIFKKFRPRKKFNYRTLRMNDISLLILDERWRHLFDKNKKTGEIIKCEEILRKQIKDEAALNSEYDSIPDFKKRHMDRIIELTDDTFDKNDKSARDEMDHCQDEIIRLNKRIREIEDELYNLSAAVKKTNVKLLEHTVNAVYFKMKKNHSRIDELETLIEETKSRLMKYINEKESLSETYTETYSYFHDLLGGEEMEKLDREYFGKV